MKIINNKEISNILYYVKLNNLNLREASSKLGISESTLKGYCYSFRDIGDTSYKKLKHFSQVLNCRVEDLVD